MKIAIVQCGPVHNNLAESLLKLDTIMSDIANHGCDMVVFGETWLCGYPAWIDYCTDTGLWDNPKVKRVWSDIYRNAVDIKGDSFAQLSALIQKYKLMTIIGVNEVVTSGKGNGSIYNAILTFGGDGTLMNHHRKLVPTFTEKLIYNQGDGAGLRVVDSPFGKIGSLICWEHWMPLTRQVMHDEGEEIHFALWPTVKEMNIIACRQYAFEGRCHVVAVGQMMSMSDTPEGLTIDPAQRDNPYAMSGGSCVVSPDGSMLLTPQYERDEVLYVEIPTGNHIPEKMNLAVSGNYQRHDIFDLSVDRSRKIGRSF